MCIRDRVDEVRAAGYHAVSFNASAMPSGLYIYRMVSGQMTFTSIIFFVNVIWPDTIL